MSYHHQAILIAAILLTTASYHSPWLQWFYQNDPIATMARSHRNDATSGEASNCAMQ